MTKTMMTIREMCEKFDVTPRTLRFYEEKKLLSPTRVGRRRLFTRRDCARMTLILQGKRFGFSLGEIYSLFDIYDKNGKLAQIKAAYKIAKNRYDDLKAEWQDLGAVIEEMETKLSWGRKMIVQLESNPHARHLA